MIVVAIVKLPAGASHGLQLNDMQVNHINKSDRRDIVTTFMAQYARVQDDHDNICHTNTGKLKWPDWSYQVKLGIDAMDKLKDRIQNENLYLTKDLKDILSRKPNIDLTNSELQAQFDKYIKYQNCLLNDFRSLGLLLHLDSTKYKENFLQHLTKSMDNKLADFKKFARIAHGLNPFSLSAAEAAQIGRQRGRRTRDTGTRTQSYTPNEIAALRSVFGTQRLLNDDEKSDWDIKKAVVLDNIYGCAKLIRDFIAKYLDFPKVKDNAMTPELLIKVKIIFKTLPIQEAYEAYCDGDFDELNRILNLAVMKESTKHTEMLIELDHALYLKRRNQNYRALSATDKLKIETKFANDRNIAKDLLHQSPKSYSKSLIKSMKRESKLRKKASEKHRNVSKSQSKADQMKRKQKQSRIEKFLSEK